MSTVGHELQVSRKQQMAFDFGSRAARYREKTDELAIWPAAVTFGNVGAHQPLPLSFLQQPGAGG
ncbi:MAG TPA: hypothetical protein VLT16_11380 [Candidatus Limnocylindrales bacterium]|nr:hypothetical protein [Candidatus Limnocylindrales bacterium]